MKKNNAFVDFEPASNRSIEVMQHEIGTHFILGHNNNNKNVENKTKNKPVKINSNDIFNKNRTNEVDSRKMSH